MGAGRQLRWYRVSLGDSSGRKDQGLVQRAGRGTLKLEFTQKGNPMKGFKVDEFDPMEHRRDGSRLVLVVKSNQVERVRRGGRERQVAAADARPPDGVDQGRASVANVENEGAGSCLSLRRLMSETTRTFFAIEIPELLWDGSFDRVQEVPCAELPGCRWASGERALPRDSRVSGRRAGSRPGPAARACRRERGAIRAVRAAVSRAWELFPRRAGRECCGRGCRHGRRRFSRRFSRRWLTARGRGRLSLRRRPVSPARDAGPIQA